MNAIREMRGGALSEARPGARWAAVREIHRLAFPTDAEARLVDALRAGDPALVRYHPEFARVSA